MLQENLINLATGKAARKETEEYLLNTLMRGDNERKRFLEEWIDLPSRFLQTVKRIKVSNFASESLSQKKISPTDNKINKAESARDVFIRIALLASSNSNFDLKRVMSFPITKYPLSLSHSDGTPLICQKSVLLHKLESLNPYVKIDLGLP